MPRQPLGGEDRTENAQVGNAHSKVDSAHSNAQAFVSDKTVGTSQTQTGANTWMSSFISDVNTHLGNIESTKAHNLTVRESMHTQAARGRELSPVLLSASDIAASHQDPPLKLSFADGRVEKYATSDAYLSALEEQKNAQREARAKEILDQINTEALAEEKIIYSPKGDYVPDAWQSHGDDGRRGGGAGGGLVPTVGAHTVAGSGSSEWTTPAPGEPGSASNPISDPAELARYDLTTTPVNQRMTPNGPVGGHMPADVLNVDDPAWRAVPPSGGGARIAGGVLMATSGVGAAGVAVSHGGGFSGIGGLATGVAGSPLRSVAPAGGVLRPSALLGGGAVGRGAGVAGMRSGVAPVGSGGAGGRGGLVGSSGLSEARSGDGGAGSARGATGGRGAAGSARGAAGVVETRGGAGSRGGVAGRGGAGSARGAAGSARGAAGVVGSGSKGRGKKKDEARRRNYEVVRVDGLDESTVGVMGGGAGSADQLRPVCRDAGEDW